MPSLSCEITASMELGVPGYTFADLHHPERLASLYERFCEEVQASDPRLWAEWDDYRRTPDAPRAPVTRSRLLVSMAPYVSRFVGAVISDRGGGGGDPPRHVGAGRSISLQDRIRQTPRVAAGLGGRDGVVHA